MKKIKYILILLISILIGQQSLSAVEVDELLLDRLIEKGTITKEEAAEIRAEAAIKTQEELAQKKKFNVEGKSKIDLSGYIQGQYLADETAGKFDEFSIRRARLDFRGSVSKDIGWRLQVDAVQPLKSVVESVSQNATTKNITTKTTKVVTRPVLLDVYIDYNLYSFANFRVGQFLLPFGLENLTSDSVLDTINRAQVTEKLVPGRDIGSQGRDIGGQISGEFDFGTQKKILEYIVGIFNGAGINVGDDNEIKDVAGRLLVFPISGLSVGISYYNGESGSTKTDKIRTDGEITYTISNLFLKTEYVLGKDGSTDKYGWYSQVGYKLIPELETVAKYDSYDPNKNQAGDRTDVATLGLNWFVNKWAKIRANYEWKIEENTQIHNNALFTQFQVQF